VIDVQQVMNLSAVGVTKPFSIAQFTARVSASLARTDLCVIV
jgi:hypothetical protein